MEIKECTTLSDRIKFILDSEGISSNDLAELLQVSPAYISQVVSGKKQLSNPAIELISKTYGMNRNWLLYGTGEIYFNKSTLDKSLKIIHNIFEILDPELQDMGIQYFKYLSKKQADINRYLEKRIQQKTNLK